MQSWAQKVPGCQEGHKSHGNTQQPRAHGDDIGRGVLRGDGAAGIGHVSQDGAVQHGPQEQVHVAHQDQRQAHAHKPPGAAGRVCKARGRGRPELGKEPEGPSWPPRERGGEL